MKPFLFLCLALLLLISCTTKKRADNDGTKLLDYGYFTVRVPQDWKRVNAKGIDSYVGRIDIDSSSSIGFNMGWYCKTLSEGHRTKYYDIEGENVYTPDSSAKQNLNDPNVWKYYGRADSSTLEKLRRQKVSWTIISRYKAKLVVPKMTGVGTTGVYIDSLWRTGDHPDGFVMSGENLPLQQQQQLIKAIKTLKFYQHPEKRKKSDNE